MSEYKSYSVGKLYKMTKATNNEGIKRCLDMWYKTIMDTVEKGDYQVDLYIPTKDIDADENYPHDYVFTAMDKLKNEIFPGLRVILQHDEEYTNTTWYEVSWNVGDIMASLKDTKKKDDHYRQTSLDKNIWDLQQ
jgi:hypothetical protein